MGQIWQICLGGAVGTGARYLLSVWAQRALGSAFPFGTLLVNTTGSFLIAVVMYLGTQSEALSPSARLVLASGVLGGFTTYSTFTYETMRYLQQGSWSLAALNVIATLGGCMTACLLGWAAARLLAGG